MSLVAAGIAVVGSPASAGADFTFGSGFAQASLVVPAINAGELSIPVIFGEAAAGYQDETGRATSTMFQIPLLGATSGGGTQCGVPSDGLALPLPPPVYSDTSTKNNKGDVDKTENSDGLGIVKQEAHAKPRAKGDSRIEFTDIELPGLVAIGGATAHAVTQANADSETRKATATTRVADVSLFGGIVRITGMRWELTQVRDGTDSRTSKPKVDHSFTFDGLTANGMNIPIATPGGAAAAVATANGVLKPLGLSFELPKFVDNGKGRQQMTPFVVKIGGPDFLLTPVLGAVLSQEQFVTLQGDLFEALFDPKDCDQLLGLMKAIPELNAQYNTVGEVAPLLVAALMGFLSGGSTTLSIGGVTVSLDDTYYAPLDFGTPDYVQSPGTPAVPGMPGSQLTALPRVRSVGGTRSPISKTSKCHTSSPAGSPGCWDGLAPFGAATAGIVAVGALVADEITTRRRLRRNEIG